MICDKTSNGVLIPVNPTELMDSAGIGGDIRAFWHQLIIGTTGECVGERPDKGMMVRWSGRMISHSGTERRSRSPRGAAGGNFGQWGKP